MASANTTITIIYNMLSKRRAITCHLVWCVFNQPRNTHLYNHNQNCTQTTCSGPRSCQASHAAS